MNNKKCFSALPVGVFLPEALEATAEGTESGSHTIPTTSSLHLIPQRSSSFVWHCATLDPLQLLLPSSLLRTWEEKELLAEVPLLRPCTILFGSPIKDVFNSSFNLLPLKSTAKG